MVGHPGRRRSRRWPWSRGTCAIREWHICCYWRRGPSDGCRPIDIVHGALSDDGSLYVGSTPRDTLLVLYLGASVQAELRAVELSAVNVVRPLGDGSRILLYFGYFQVYDMTLDSILFREGVWPGVGDVDVSADKKTVFLTDPGDIDYPPAPYTFKRLSLVSMSMDSVIVASTCSELGYFRAGEVEVTPDGKWLVAKEPSVGFSWFGKNYLVQDLTGAIQPRTYCVPAYKMYLACQSGK